MHAPLKHVTHWDWLLLLHVFKIHLYGNMCPVFVFFLFQNRSAMCMDYCSLPGSSVRGILQARVLMWIASPFSRDLLDPGMEPRPPEVGSLPSEPPGKPKNTATPSPGELPDPGIEPGSPALQADSLPADGPEKPNMCPYLIPFHCQIFHFIYPLIC